MTTSARPIRTLFKSICALLMASFVLSASFTGYAQAAMISTDAVVAQQAAAADRAHVMNLLERDDVREQLAAYGVDPAEAEARVAALSDAEIRQLSNDPSAEPAGAGTGGALIGAALTVFLVLLITDILCLTDVFDFTRCSRN